MFKILIATGLVLTPAALLAQSSGQMGNSMGQDAQAQPRGSDPSAAGTPTAMSGHSATGMHGMTHHKRTGHTSMPGSHGDPASMPGAPSNGASPH